MHQRLSSFWVVHRGCDGELYRDRPAHRRAQSGARCGAGLRRKQNRGGHYQGPKTAARRKLARWAADNVSVIKELKPPPQPPNFNNRLSANWKLPLQIAQHAGGGCRAGRSCCRIPFSHSCNAAIGVPLL
jgi:Protein of unknown function (DUF3631)